ncbi:MAG: hypothetical protein EAZ60_04185 [Oscillatoriales cyanobacterium]|nr:MAG: hypothetical protein EAZ79_02415 [Oscillatoriales cyanobacterium]TAF39281.1 MAG: hypothetical protein EAZ69_01545 [Oscillatoriales cyanobacterium]TAF58201.1 MAG: hypothetical protein EAZ60_04185 [Oscillatoriales cyanobacterium]
MFGKGRIKEENPFGLSEDELRSETNAIKFTKKVVLSALIAVRCSVHNQPVMKRNQPICLIQGLAR